MSIYGYIEKQKKDFLYIDIEIYKSQKDKSVAYDLDLKKVNFKTVVGRLVTGVSGLARCFN